MSEQIKTWDGKSLPIAKNATTITLERTEIARVREGQTAWAYPSVPTQSKQDDGSESLSEAALQAGVDKLRAWLGSKRFNESVLDMFDLECQQTWRIHQDESKFIEALTSDVQRRGREAKLSVKLQKEMTALLKIAKDDTLPMAERQTAKANHKLKQAAYLVALNDELEEIDL